MSRISTRAGPERYPAAILKRPGRGRVGGVRLAVERGWTVSVRSGGHSWAAWSLRDGALLIDLGGLRDIEYDAATGVAAGSGDQGRAGAGPVPGPTRAGLPGRPLRRGRAGRVPAAGGPGVERPGPRLGLPDVAGRRVRGGGSCPRRRRQHADLLWAARGAGPGFPGVITRFYLQTYPPPARCGRTPGRFGSTTPRGAALAARPAARSRPAGRAGGRGHPAARRPAPPRPASRRNGPAAPHDGAWPARRTRPSACSTSLEHGPLARARDRPRQQVRPRWPRRTWPRRHRTPMAIGTPWTAPGPTPPAACSPRCCWISGASSPRRTRSRSGTAGLLRGYCRTWPSPWRATSTSRRTSSTPTRPTTPGTPGWVHARTAGRASAGGVGVYLGDTDFTRRRTASCPTATYQRLAVSIRAGV